jgi:lipid II isoglutaminyl synthase (glutamine-hydrolysing)
VERDLERSLDAAVAGANGDRLFALPTYTALLELRDLLARRGLAKRWSE